MPGTFACTALAQSVWPWEAIVALNSPRKLGLTGSRATDAKHIVVALSTNIMVENLNTAIVSDTVNILHNDFGNDVALCIIMGYGQSPRDGA